MKAYQNPNTPLVENLPGRRRMEGTKKNPHADVRESSGRPRGRRDTKLLKNERSEGDELGDDEGYVTDEENEQPHTVRMYYSQVAKVQYPMLLDANKCYYQNKQGLLRVKVKAAPGYMGQT